LTDTQVEITRGEAVVEVSEFEKDNSISVLNHGAVTKVLKVGLYRFTAEPAVAQVLLGKADVLQGDRHVSLGKDHEVMLTEDLKPKKFQAKSAEDDLYAWSKVRDEYVAAASYSAAKSLSTTTGYTGAGYGYSGMGAYPGRGWFWNAGWNSWAWLPGEGAFFSPFGYGYYSPYYVGYAPVVYLPVNGARPVAVPVNPTKPVVVAGGKPAVPVIPGHGPVTASSWAHVNNGSHVSAPTVARSSAPASQGPAPAARGGGGYAGPSAASSRASAPPPAMSSPHGAAPAGHK